MDFLSPGHIIVIAVVALVILFGSKRLPEMSRSVGRSLRIFKAEMKALDDDITAPATAATPVSVPAVAPVVAVVATPTRAATAGE